MSKKKITPQKKKAKKRNIVKNLNILVRIQVFLALKKLRPKKIMIFSLQLFTIVENIN